MSKLKSELLLMADFALTSREGKLSIIGIFDRIFVHQTPAKYPRFFIVSSLSGEENSKHQVELNLESPDGKKILPAKTMEVTLAANGRANIITDIANVAFDQIGEYHLQVYADDKSIASTPFFVTKVNPPQESQKLPN